MPTLENLTILNTRPAHQAQELNEKLATLGARVTSFPTIEITDAEDPLALQQAISNLKQYDIAIFISPNAVFKTFRLLPNPWPARTKIAAVGAGTVKALNGAALPIAFYPPEQFNSEALLALPELQQVKSKKIILFRGKNGRELLADTLRNRGALVTNVDCYQRTLPQNVPKLRIHPDIIICTSNTGLQNLVTLLDKQNQSWLFNTPLLVISQRMAEFAHKLGFVKPVLIADNASNKAILNTLISWQEK